MENQPVSVNLKNRVTLGANSSLGQRPGSSFSPEPNVSQSGSEQKDKKFVVKIFDRVIEVAIFMMFLGIPLFFTGLTFQGIVFEKQLYFYFWLLLGLVSWVSKGVVTGEMKIRRTPLDLPILGFLVVYVVSTALSIDRWHSFWGAFSDPSRGLMSVVALTLSYYLIFSTFTKKRLKNVLIALITSNGIVAVWTLLGILNIQFLPAKVAQFAPLSLIGSIMGLGMYFSAMVILVAFSVLAVSDSEGTNAMLKKISFAGLLILLGLNLFLLLALYNFVPWLSLFVGVVVFLVFILSQIVRPNTKWTWLPMALFIVVMGIRMTGVVPIAKVNFAEVKPLDYQTSLDISLSSAKEKFFFGSGPATFGYDFSLYRPQEFNLNMLYNLRFLQGTGLGLEAVSTIGAVGAFFLAILFLSFVSIEMYLISKEKEKNKLYSLGFFSAALILIVGVISLKAEGTMLLLAALLATISLAAVLAESESRENYLNLSLKASPKFALALAFIFMVVSAGVAFMFVFIGKMYAADAYAGASLRESTTDREKAVATMARAINLNKKEGRYYTKLGEYYMIMANAEAMKKEEERDVQKIKVYLNNSIAATQIGENNQKLDVGTVETLAQIYENAGLYVADSLDLAIKNYERALELEPYNPTFYLKIGQIKIGLAASKKEEAEKKQLAQEARAMFQKSVDLKSDFDSGYYQLSLIEDALGNRDAAIENGRKAVEINKQNGEYILSLGRMYQMRGNADDLKTAEQIFKAVISGNDKDISSHFYLGLLYEKTKKKAEAKEEYRKVLSLLEESNSSDLKSQLQKMISNVDAGVENTPETLGLIKKQEESANNQEEPIQE